MLEISLAFIVLLVLVLPVTVHFVERNLEAFLFVMGVLAVTFSHFLGNAPVWSLGLAEEALREPLMITAAVLVFGLIVFFLNKPITSFIVRVERRLGPRLFSFALIAALGIFSSVITAIMAAIILVEVVNALKLDKEYELRLVVLGCFSIGLGAALTPIGEPLSTIAIAKLRGEPHNAGFFYLLQNLGWYIIPGVFVFGLLGALSGTAKKAVKEGTLSESSPEKGSDVVVRAVKVYFFIMALVLLGTGFKPVIDKYIIPLPAWALYWINTVSAVMDNATLAAAEIGPKMTLGQVQAVLMGLLVAGGMLIPGNIPNIIAAGRLNIRSKDWARIGVPLGFAIMVAYFVILGVI